MLAEAGPIAMSLLLVILAVAATADDVPEPFRPELFTDLGEQCHRNAVYNHALGLDADGDECYYVACTGQPGFLLPLDPRTGEGPQVDFTDCPGHPWGIWWASNNRLYVSFGGGEGDVVLCYDPADGSLENLGHATDSEIVVWTLWEASDGKLYGGTYPNAKLVSVDLQTHEITDLGRISPDQKYIRSVACEGDYVYCNAGPSKPAVWAYNIHTGEKTQVLPEHLRETAGWGGAKNCSDGHVYIFAGDERFRANGTELNAVDEAPSPVPAAYQGSTSKMRLVLSDGTVIRQDVLSGPDRRYFLHEPDGTTDTVTFDYSGTANRLWSVVNGPDGRIYGSTHSPITLFAYDPAIGETEVLGDPVHSHGQVYGKCWHNGKLYMASYGKSRVTVYDPQRPWDYGVEPDNNPRYLGSCHIGRPSAMVVAPDDHHILIGGVPGYGSVGGVLTIVDPDEPSVEVLDGIVEAHSIYSMVTIPDSNLVCLGTTCRGGSASEAEQTDARLVLWDFSTREVVFETEPVEGEQVIEQLVYRNGKVYATVGDTGHLVVFDPSSHQVLHTAALGHGKPALFGLGYREAGGMLYAIAGNSLLRIDPDTYEVERVAAHPEMHYGMAFSGDSVYFCAGARMMGCRVE
jgi:hypothetical protein